MSDYDDVPVVDRELLTLISNLKEDWSLALNEFRALSNSAEVDELIATVAKTSFTFGVIEERLFNGVERDLVDSVLTELYGVRNEIAQQLLAAMHFGDRLGSGGLRSLYLEFSKVCDDTLKTLDLFLISRQHPKLPQFDEQEPGAKFSLTEQGVDFIPEGLYLPVGDDLRRLQSLLPIVRHQVDGACEVFGRGNVQFPRIYTTLCKYRAVLEASIDAIDYDRLAAYGIILASSEAAALRDVADRTGPEFENDEAAELRGLLDLHGPFILATDAGKRLLEDAAAYNLTREQEAIQKKAAVAIANAVADQELATPSAEELLVTATSQIGMGPFQDRSAVIGFGTVRNFAVVALGGAAVVMYGGVALQTVGTILVYEGIKKSKVGQTISGVFQDALDSPSQRRNLKKLYRLVMDYEADLRVLAGQRRELNWINSTIDWIKAKTPDE